MTLLAFSFLLAAAIGQNLMVPHASNLGSTETAAIQRTLTVPDDFPAIQLAIDNASETDTIVVRSGTYNESLVIDVSISLIGEGRDCTTVQGELDSHVINVLANNVTIRGFKIVSGETGPLKIHSGIELINVDHVNIRDNTITGNFVGISLGDQYRGSHHNIIQDNKIMRNRYGIFLAHSDENTIFGNTIADSMWNGIELDWCTLNTLCGNWITNSTAYGLEIPLETPGSGNIFYHNSFINNNLKVAVSGYENNWDNGYPSGGNYWDDYDGFDQLSGQNQTETGSDGIGDEPYIIDQNNRDSYPLTSAIHTFRAPSEAPTYFHLASNATVSNFDFLPTDPPSLQFNVESLSQVSWFCRLTIPNTVLWCDNSWIIYLNETTVDPMILDDSDNTFLYFTRSSQMVSNTRVTVVGTGAIPELDIHTVCAIVMSTVAASIVSHSRRSNHKHRKADIPVLDPKHDRIE